MSPTAKITSQQWPVFWATESRMVTNWSVWHVYDQLQQLYFDFVSFIQLQHCEPCLFCHISILIHDIIQASCVFHLYTVLIGLPRLWDTVSMNLTQKNMYSRLSLNGHLYKTNTSVKRTLKSWSLPFFTPFIWLSIRRTLSAGPKGGVDSTP